MRSENTFSGDADDLQARLTRLEAQLAETRRHIGRNYPQKLPDFGIELQPAKITSAATMGGVYFGKRGTRILSAFDPATSGALAVADFFEFSEDEDIVIVNFAEFGANTHELEVDGTLVAHCRIRGRDTSNRFIGELVGITSPEDLCENPTAVTLAGSGAAADTVSASDASDKIITETYVSRLHDDTAAKIIYVYTRQQVIACGRVLSKTAETRSAIINYGPCT